MPYIPSTNPWEGFREYAEKLWGEHWVIAVRSKGNLARYEGYTFVTKKQYQKAYEDFLKCR